MSNRQQSASADLVELAHEDFSASEFLGSSQFPDSGGELSKTSVKVPERRMTPLEELLGEYIAEVGTSLDPSTNAPEPDYIESLFASLAQEVPDSDVASLPIPETLRTRTELEAMDSHYALIHRAPLGGHTAVARRLDEMPPQSDLPKWFTKHASDGDIERRLLHIGYFRARPSIEVLNQYLLEHKDLLQPPSEYAHDELSKVRKCYSKRQKRRLKKKQGGTPARPWQDESAELFQLESSSDYYLRTLIEPSRKLLRQLQDCTLEHPCEIIGCINCSYQRHQRLINRIGAIVKRFSWRLPPEQAFVEDYSRLYRGSHPYFVTITVADPNTDAFEASESPNPWLCTAQNFPSVIESMSEIVDCLRTSPSHRGAFAAVDAAPPDKCYEGGSLIVRGNSDLLAQLERAKKNYKGYSHEQLAIHLRLQYQLHLHCIVIDREAIPMDNRRRDLSLTAEIEAKIKALNLDFKLRVDVIPAVFDNPRSRKYDDTIGYATKFTMLEPFDSATRRQIQRFLFGVQTEWATGVFSGMKQTLDTQSEFDVKHDSHIEQSVLAGLHCGERLLQLVKTDVTSIEQQMKELRRAGRAIVTATWKVRDIHNSRAYRRRQADYISGPIAYFETKSTVERGKPKNREALHGHLATITESRSEVQRITQSLFLQLAQAKLESNLEHKLEAKRPDASALKIGNNRRESVTVQELCQLERKLSAGPTVAEFLSTLMCNFTKVRADYLANPSPNHLAIDLDQEWQGVYPVLTPEDAASYQLAWADSFWTALRY